MTLQTTKETWFEAEATPILGEIALKSLEQDASKAEPYFDRRSWSLVGSRQLRAAMSLACFWRDQGVTTAQLCTVRCGTME
jgi:hypothetical protein